MNLLNIICKLESIAGTFVTLKKIEINDFAVNKTIETFLENEQVIFDHYNELDLTKIFDIDFYLDYLFLNNILLYADHFIHMRADVGNRLVNLIEFCGNTKKKVSMSKLISFINEGYNEIFLYDNRCYSYEVKNITLELIVKYKNGIKNLNRIIDFLIFTEPILLFDNLEKLESLFNEEKLKFLLCSEATIKEIIKYRLEESCFLLKKIHEKKQIKLSKEFGNKLYLYIINNLDNAEIDIYKIASEANRIFEILLVIKHEKSDHLKSILKEIECKLEVELENSGTEIEHKYSSKAYSNAMRKTEGEVSSFKRYLYFTSLGYDNKWLSHIEQLNINYKRSIVDYGGSIDKTNDYFSLGRVSHITRKIIEGSIHISYWISNENLIREFKYNLKYAIYKIFENLKIKDFDDLELNIEGLIETFTEYLDDKEKLHKRINTLFYTIALTEKIFRKIYIVLEEIKQCDEANLSLKNYLGDKNGVNSKLEKLVGFHLIKWLRYYLSYDEPGIGKDLRNRIAHFYDINLKSLKEVDVYVVFFLLISTVNTIYLNLLMEND